MNQITKRILSLVVALGLIASSGFAATGTSNQTASLAVPEIAVIATSGNVSTMTFVAPAAGVTPADVTDNSTYLEYTSTTNGTATRKISAKLSSATVPAGAALKIVAVTGGTNEGTAQTAFDLTISDQDLITGVGTVATGTGSAGVQVTYTLHVTSMSDLDISAASDSTVVFTLAAAV